MGHFSLVSNWRPHLGAISWFLKSLLTVSFLDFNWAEAAPHDTGKCEQIEFSVHYKGFIQAPKWQPAQISVKDCVTPAERKTWDTDAGFCHWQLRNAEQVEERNVYAKFCSPLEEFAFLCCLAAQNRGWGFRLAIWLVPSFMKSFNFRHLMLSSKEVIHPAPEKNSALEE